MKERILFSEAVTAILRQSPIMFVDVGARGALEPPWSMLPDGCLRVLGFEPDEDECRRLRNERPQDLFVPKALWANPGRVDLHVARFPGCSSVHPPNVEVINRYLPAHGEPRDTVQVVEYASTTLDQAVGDLGISADFLKLDTQGSEFEILTGSEQSLEGAIFGAVIETWTSEVHSGQALTGDVMRIMTDRGFSLFDISVAAAWERRAARGLELGGRRQVVGLDLLFFKEPALLKGDSQLIKAAAIADVYGYPDFALQILENVDLEVAVQLSDALINHPNPSPPRKTRPWFRRDNGDTVDEQFARLHY